MDPKKQTFRFVAYVIDHADREAWFALAVFGASGILAAMKRHEALDVVKYELFDPKVMTALEGIL